MLKQRIITAVILVAFLGWAIFGLSPTKVWIVFAAVIGLAGWEWGGFLRLSSSARIVFGINVAVTCVALHVLQISPAGILIISGLFWILGIPAWLRFQWRLVDYRLAGLLVGMVLLVATWVAFVVLHQSSPWLLLAVMALVWVADIAAYFSGRNFGRHKLAPTISPGKTWEGVCGAMIGVSVYGLFVIKYSSLAVSWPFGMALSIILLIALTGVSVIGDLFESLLKRHAGIKDSSNLLPGHGGVLDRIDSLISTVPVVALMVIASK